MVRQRRHRWLYARVCNLTFARFVQNAASPEVLYQEFFHCEDLGTQLKPVIERFHASEAYKTNRPAANAKQDPPVRQDNSITLSKPIKLADATSQATGPVSVRSISPSNIAHALFSCFGMSASLRFKS